MLEEMDADFGIGGLVEQEFQAGARKVCISTVTVCLSQLNPQVTCIMCLE